MNCAAHGDLNKGNDGEIFLSRSSEDTEEFAYRFGRNLKPGSVVALRGPLGAGKTAFVRGLAAGFGISSVTSPTYTLVNHYEGTIPIYHFDVYRIDNRDDDLREWMDEYLFGDGICVIEWADKIENLLPKETVWVEISEKPDSGENSREIKIC